MGDRIRWAFHKGKPVLRVDYSGLKGAEMLAVIQQVPGFYKDQPKGSVLCLADVRDTFADGPVMGAMKNLVKETRPYDKKVAVLGITGAKSVLLSAVNLFSAHSIKPFSSEQEALDWLIS